MGDEYRSKETTDKTVLSLHSLLSTFIKIGNEKDRQAVLFTLQIIMTER